VRHNGSCEFEVPARLALSVIESRVRRLVRLPRRPGRFRVVALCTVYCEATLVPLAPTAALKGAPHLSVGEEPQMAKFVRHSPFLSRERSASARLETLEREIAAILALYPELRWRFRRTQQVGHVKQGSPSAVEDHTPLSAPGSPCRWAYPRLFRNRPC
jgi:hypothetical protein